MSLGTSLGSSEGKFDGSAVGSLVGRLVGSFVGRVRDGLRLVLALLSAGALLSGESCPPEAISTTAMTAPAATITASRTNSGRGRLRGGGP
jgi:hypothetical protein